MIVTMAMSSLKRCGGLDSRNHSSVPHLNLKSIHSRQEDFFTTVIREKIRLVPGVNRVFQSDKDSLSWRMKSRHMLLLVSLAILPLYLHGEKCTQVNFLGGIRRPVLIMLDHCSLAQLFQVFCRTPNSAGDDYRINSFFGLYFLFNSFCL